MLFPAPLPPMIPTAVPWGIRIVTPSSAGAGAAAKRNTTPSRAIVRWNSIPCNAFGGSEESCRSL